MTNTNKLLGGKNLLILIICIIILSYFFYVGMLLWGLIVVFPIIFFIWVIGGIVTYIREYIELNKKHIELCNKYLTQKMKQQDDEIESEYKATTINPHR